MKKNVSQKKKILINIFYFEQYFFMMATARKGRTQKQTKLWKTQKGAIEKEREQEINPN